jgi:DNA repair protein RAD16
MVGPDSPGKVPFKMRLRERPLVPSAKLRAVTMDIESSIAHSKVVVFSEYTRMLDLVDFALHEKGIDCFRLQGNMKLDNRKMNIELFRNASKNSVLLVSIQAGGEGLNLQFAHRAILIEPSWNPAVEEQAIARLLRIGQTMKVRVTRYIVSNSIEERVLELQARKREIFRRTIDGGSNFSDGLTMQDMIYLLTKHS